MNMTRDIYENVYVPNEDEMRKFNAELIEGLYSEGLVRRGIIANEMEFGRFRDRHFVTKTFGNESPDGIHADRMNGTTGGLSYNEYYHQWRERVLQSLSSSYVSSYLRLSFESVPSLLIDEKYRHAYGDTIMEVALKTFDDTLEKLLGIISKLPSPAGALPTKMETGVGHILKAELIDRDGQSWLVLMLDGQRWVAKKGLRKGFAPDKVAKKLFKSVEKTVSRESIGIGSKRRMSDIAQEIGFKGMVHKKLLVASVGTLRLHHEVNITTDEMHVIQDECQELFNME